MGNAERGRKAISVFVVSVDLPQPLFLDRVHVAKAIDDTVVIVQNSQLTIPSNVLCNGHPQTIYGRNPLREALSATAHALHGLLPSHAADQRHHVGCLLVHCRLFFSPLTVSIPSGLGVGFRQLAAAVKLPSADVLQPRRGAYNVLLI